MPENTKIEALRAAIVEGERSGASTPFDFDEFVAGALRPGRHHAAVGMPDGAETLPIAGIAPDRPVLQQCPDQAIVFNLAVASGHCGGFLRVLYRRHTHIDARGQAEIRCG